MKREGECRQGILSELAFNGAIADAQKYKTQIKQWVKETEGKWTDDVYSYGKGKLAKFFITKVYLDGIEKTVESMRHDIGEGIRREYFFANVIIYCCYFFDSESYNGTNRQILDFALEELRHPETRFSCMKTLCEKMDEKSRKIFDWKFFATTAAASETTKGEIDNTMTDFLYSQNVLGVLKSEPLDRVLYVITQIPDDTLVEPLLAVIKNGINSPLFDKRYNSIYSVNHNRVLYLILKADQKYHFLTKNDKAKIKQKLR